MLSGRPPFPDGTTLQKLLQHQAEEPPDVRQLRPDVPVAVVEILQTMLAKKPEERFQNPAELVAALGAVAEKLGVSRPLGAIPTEWLTPVREPSWFRRHAPWFVPAVLLVLSVIGLWVWSLQDQSAPAFPELRIPDRPGAAETSAPAEATRDAASGALPGNS